MSTHPNRATGARAPRAAGVPQAAPLAPHQADDGDAPYEIAAESSWRTWLDDQVSWLTSSVLHAVALLVLALIPVLSNERPFVSAVDSALLPPDDPLDPMNVPTIAFGEPVLRDALPDLPAQSMPNTLWKESVEIEPGSELKTIVSPGRPSSWTPQPDGDSPSANPSTWRKRPGNRRRGTLNTTVGPSDDSEAAVDAALAWLAAHQLPDGSWSFDHRGGICNGRCKNHGQFAAAKNAATGLALLTFLGAGETHLEGRYQKTVDAGLRYLLATQKLAGAAGSWHEAVGNSGNYSHAIATLAVCEAYAMAQLPPAPKKPPKSPSEMTEEERRKWKEERERAKQRRAAAIDEQRLAAAAQAGVNYLVEGQHSAGGWRYNNGQAGDTSVVGWALMALKSGHLSKVKVPVDTVVRTSKFLDSVQEGDYGAIYHYMADKNRPTDALKATTSIGLLCRMYLGWDKNHPGIAEGTAQLARWEPSTVGGTNMYYNYYATQVMHHYGGDPWKKWNLAIREHLVKTQAKDGHERGSWHFTGDHGATAGGRLYATTLAAMTLEVYYRYLPIYRDRSVEDDLQGK